MDHYRLLRSCILGLVWIATFPLLSRPEELVSRDITTASTGRLTDSFRAIDTPEDICSNDTLATVFQIAWSLHFVGSLARQSLLDQVLSKH